MVIGVKDGFRLFGITVICFCAVFVCTFFLNFYLDAKLLEGSVTEANRALYEAQLAMAQFTSGISGGFLAVIAVVMTVFEIRLYVYGHIRGLGILKAMGWSNGKIAVGFWVFGLSVLLGTSLGFGAGFAIMPVIYDGLAVTSLNVAIHFHPVLLVLLVFVPPVVYALLACVCALVALRRPVTEMLRGKTESRKRRNVREREENRERSAGKSDRSFLFELSKSMLSSHKSLVFFVAFACFCFSAMVQMSASMEELSSRTMGLIILAIGIVLAGTSMVMAVTALVNHSRKTVAMMKALGYTLFERAASVFGGYVPFALLGFGLGTVYQYGLLYLMIHFVFQDVGNLPEYHFSVPVFFITLAAFIALYAALTAAFAYRMGKISVKEIMAEE